MIRAGVVLLAIATLTIPASANGCAIELPETDMNNIIIINPGAGSGGSDPALAGRVSSLETNVRDPFVGQPAVVGYGTKLVATYVVPPGDKEFLFLGEPVFVPGGTSTEGFGGIILGQFGFAFDVTVDVPTSRVTIERQTHAPTALDIEGADDMLVDRELTIGVSDEVATGVVPRLAAVEAGVGDIGNAITSLFDGQNILSNRLDNLEAPFEVFMPAVASSVMGVGGYDLTGDADLSAFAGGWFDLSAGELGVGYAFTAAASGQVAAMTAALNANGFVFTPTADGPLFQRPDGTTFVVTNTGAEAVLGIPNGTWVDNGTPAGPQPFSLRAAIQLLLDRP